jgi:tRNA-uridine 2-sulfurtransferase
MARVFVAMSGGVDSSVSAALLLEAGHDVAGVTMQLWPSSDSEGPGRSGDAIRDARGVCDLLGIAHHTVDFREAFQTAVVGAFADEYARGRTPNPCIVCNDALKFANLLAEVVAQGADFLATGHYARIVRDHGGTPWLTRAADPSKDQSYFLYRLTRTQMEHVMFPVGGLRKSEVRAIAQRLSLAVAEKPDSQEVCFAPAGEHASVVRRLRPEALVAGEVVDLTGRIVGSHDGIANYTIGQRKGLGIGGGPSLYVVDINPAENRIVVGAQEALRVSALTATNVVWHAEAHVRIEAMVRYRMTAKSASASLTDTQAVPQLRVDFDEPLEAVAPGQAVVCYQEDRVVGGGVIQCAT